MLEKDHMQQSGQKTHKKQGNSAYVFANSMLYTSTTVM